MRSPSAEDAARAEDIGAALERLAGRPAPASRPMGEGLDAGARAFVAREAAAIASALDRASRSLAAHPGSRESLAGVTQAMSALRGVAVLNDLPPLGDVLVGVEGAVREVSATSGEVRESVAAAFGAGAKTLARAAREVVDLGRPAADGEEAAAFAALLLRAFAGSGDVIPVESLFYDDAGPHVIKEGVAPAGISRVEAVSQGEFLAGAAAALQRVASPVLRDLRLFGMAASLRPLAGASGSPLTNALGRLAEAGRGAIERGAAAANLTMFVALIAQAAETLRAAATGDETTLGTQLDSVSTELNSLAKDLPAAAAPAAAVPAAAAPAAAFPAAAVPAAAAPAAAAPAPASPLEGLPLLFPPPEEGPEREGARTLVPLAAAYDTLAQLAAERAAPSASLEEVFGAPEAAVVPIESLAPSAPPAEEEGGVVTVEELAHAPVPVPDASDVVAIESLLYRGPAALKHALALRPELEALLADRNGGSPRLAELLREVFDLVQLGLGAER